MIALLLLGIAAALAAGQAASAQDITVSTSGQYSSGDYIFTETTDLFAWSTGLSIRQGRIRASASIPLLVQNTPWISYGGIGPTPSGGPQHGTVEGGRRGGRRGGQSAIALPDTGSYRNTGLGDPQFRVSYDLVPVDTSALSVQLVGVVKPPVADADAGFSTGAWDGGMGVAVSRSFFPWFVLVEGTYWWLGDLDDLPLEEGLTYSVAVGQTFYGGRWGILASVTGSTTVIEGVDPPVSFNGGLNFSPGDWGLSATVSSGLSEGAADWSVGLGASVTFTR